MKKTAKTLAMILAVIMVIAMFPMTASAASYKPGRVKITTFKVGTVSKTTNTCTVTIKWNKVSKATGYQVYQLNSKGKWVRLKTLGRFYRGVKVKKVFAGQNKFKVRAIRKVKGKTYYGKFSAVKSRFIASPLTYEKVLRILGNKTEYTLDTLTIKYKGNKIYVTFNLPADSQRPSDEAINECFNDWKPDIVKECKNARLHAGVKGVSGTVRIYLGNTLLRQKTFTEYSK